MEGGLQPTGAIGAYAPEGMWNAEVGIKREWMRGRLGYGGERSELRMD